jgi:hypothetical protein
VTIDTNLKDVVDVSKTYAPNSTDGWVSYNYTGAPAAWAELAEAATTTLSIESTEQADPDRLFRVPKNVQSKSKHFSGETTTLGQIHEFAQSKYYSPEKAAEPVLTWVAKVLDRYPSEAPITAAGAFAHDEDLMYYGRTVGDEGANCDKLYAQKDSDGTWLERASGQWLPIEDPSEEASLLLLDPESAEALANWADNPDEMQGDAFEFANHNPIEFGLFAAAEAELDFEFLDRLFDIYDSTERSINASKQVRGSGGKFSPNPGGGEAAPQAPKARLSVKLPLIPNISQRIDEYLAQVAKERGEEPAAPAEGEEGAPAPAAGTPAASEVEKNDKRETNTFTAEPIEGLSEDYKQALIDTYANTSLGRQELAVTAQQAGVPESDVKPLYVAIVDDIDTDAVLDLVSLVPPQKGQQGDVSAWKRAAGQWVAAPELLSALRSSTPPSVVELSDEAVLKEVLEQVDKSTADEQTEDQPADGETEVSPEGTPAPAAAPLPDKGPAPVKTSNFSIEELGLFEIPNDELFDSMFNWVEDVGGLPQYIKRIAKHLKAKGMAEGHAIATAVNVVKKYCATGDLNWPGWQQVNPGSKAEGCAAVASWEAKKAKAKATGINVRDDWEFGVNHHDERTMQISGIIEIDEEGKAHIKNAAVSADAWRAANGFDAATDLYEERDAIRAEFKQKTALDTEHRKDAAKKGAALPDGSFPINNKEDLKKAIKAFGRAKDKPKAKRHIIKRARALDATDLLPGDWDGSTASADLLAMAARGFAFNDGSLLIRNSTELRNALSEADTLEKQLHVIKRARALNRIDLVPKHWGVTEASIAEDLWGPHGELISIAAAGGADQWRGNAERLRRYWTTGIGGIKIMWGTPRDWTRCVAHLSKYLGVRAKGYCALRHYEMNGYYPGDRRNK